MDWDIRTPADYTPTMHDGFNSPSCHVFRDYENMINIETEITTDANALNIGDSRLKIIFCSNGSPKMSDIKLAQSQIKSFLKLLEKAK